jgi:glutathione synthase/RimK-type ligase-like ATP-grasp enzyme
LLRVNDPRGSRRVSKVGLVTYRKEPTLTTDDRPLIGELEALGADARAVRWDDEAVDWAQFDALVLRSCWDYHLRQEEFDGWLHAVERARTPLYNPVSVVRWNMHKRYLAHLRSFGVLIPDTVWVDRGSSRRLSEILANTGWADAIVKPAVSASATDTWRVDRGNAVASDATFGALTRRADVLVQRFVPEVTTVGEWSLIFIDGAYSHAAKKRPRAGDFRVQTEHGGSADAATAPPDVVAAATEITRHIPAGWLFTRIDGVQTDRGFVLMEVECIEPHLFFAFAPESRGALARSVVRP